MKKLSIIIVLLFVIAVSCNDSGTTSGKSITPDAGTTAPAVIPFAIINKYPHDTASFTQGLTFYKGQLMESTGSPDNIPNNGSWLGPVELTTGKSDKKVTLDKEYFGEGMTVLNDKVYYITWQSKKGFVFDVHTFKKLKEFSYNTDGWGLTNDGKSIIMSDGTNKLYFYQPDSLRLLNIVSVNDNNGPVANINELEFVDGFIYANQWETPYILKIDPASGRVEGRMDLSKLLTEVTNTFSGADVVNGIAYDSTTKKLIITGKKWPNLFEIKLQ
jgi:glutaminyl-peptide cyclotransferase